MKKKAMNKKQRIAFWVMGILIIYTICVPLTIQTGEYSLEVARVKFINTQVLIAILIVGSLLIYTLGDRNK